MTDINYQAELQAGRITPSGLFKILTENKDRPPLILDINLNKTKMKKVIFDEENTIHVENLTDYDIIGAEFRSCGDKSLLVKVEDSSYIWVNIDNNDYEGKVKFESIGDAVRNHTIKQVHTFEGISEFKNWLVK